MTSTRPYDASEYHRDLPAELQRLHRFANLNWEKEARALRGFGLTDSMSLLEIGSGPGFYTELLTSLVPSGSVTCLDIDAKLVSHARTYLADRALAPVRFVTRSVLETGLPDDAFDFVTARLVFQHLPEPAAALREISRVLKPGGRLVVIDVDYRCTNLIYPVLPPIQEILEKTATLHRLRGGDPHIGRRVWRLLEHAGFDVLDLEAVALHSGVKGIDWCATQFDPDRLLPFVSSGLLGRDEWQRIREAADQVLADPDAFYLSVMLLTGAEKPVQHPRNSRSEQDQSSDI